VPFATLLVGLGQIGLGYDFDLDPDRYCYTHACAFSNHERFSLVAGVDPDAESRARFRARYHVPAYECVADVPADTDPDVVAVASPTAVHGQVVEEVLRRFTPRVILCEKPLAYELSAAEHLVLACEARGVALFVNFFRRADPAVIEVARRIRTGEIAGPIKGTAWYSKGFLHNGSHFVDLLEYWLGAMVAARGIDAGRARGAHDAEPDVRLEFDRGAIVFLAAREEDYSHYTVELVASNGRLRYDRGGESVQWQPVVHHPRLSSYMVLGDKPEFLRSGTDRYQWHVLSQLAEAMDGKAHHLCPGRQALDTQRRMNAVLKELSNENAER